MTSRSRVDLSEPAYHRHSTQVNEPLAETTSPNPSPLVMRPSTRVRRVNVYENQKTRSHSDMGDTHAAHLTQTLTLTITFGLYYLYIYYKIVREVHDKHRHTIRTMTRSSAIAEGPRDAPCQLKRVKCRTNVRQEALCFRVVRPSVRASCVRLAVEF